ncbi:hypothetical protein BH09MYX1_BH09MYX1_07210 [soil metagenome]
MMPTYEGMSTFTIGDEEFLVVSEPIARRHSDLTEAERAVAHLVVEGWSNIEIARRRGTAECTVANQVAALLRKLGVPSRHHIGRSLGG